MAAEKRREILRVRVYIPEMVYCVSNCYLKSAMAIAKALYCDGDLDASKRQARDLEVWIDTREAHVSLKSSI